MNDLDELVEKKRPRRADMADVVAEVRRLFEALITAEERHREDVGHLADDECPTCAFFDETRRVLEVTGFHEREDGSAFLCECSSCTKRERVVERSGSEV